MKFDCTKVLRITNSQISMAIMRRMGAGKKIILGDKNIENAKNIQKTMIDAGFDVDIMKVDLSSREDILKTIGTAVLLEEV